MKVLKVSLAEARIKYALLLKVKNYAYETNKGYVRILDNLISFLRKSGINYVEGITPELIKEYLKQRYYVLNSNGKQNSVMTRNREIIVLKKFLRMLYEEEILSEDLGVKIEYVKEPRLRLPKDILNKRELLKLFSMPDIKTLLGYRNRMILEILYATGIRRSELVNLKVEDINIKKKVVRIRQGKGSKDRIVPINITALKYVSNYIEKIRPKLQNKKIYEYLILSNKGTPVTSNGLYLILQKYLKQVSRTKNVNIHTIRHTVATHLLQKGMPLRHLQEMLGHKSLDTTIKYLHLSIGDLQREYRKYHPREKEFISN